MIRKLVLAAIGGALALTFGVASAYFTTQAQAPDSVIRAGTVAISSEPTSAPLSIDSLAPGATSVRPLTVLNKGTLSVDVVTTVAKKAGITDFYNALTCRVSDGTTMLYDGSLSAMRTTPVRIAPGARSELQFEIGLPAAAGNDLAGDYARVTVYVDAEQSH